MSPSPFRNPAPRSSAGSRGASDHGKLTPEPQTHHFNDTFQDLTKPGLFGKATIADCIPKKLPFTLRMKGRMMSGGAVVERFDAKLRFEPDTEMKVRNRLLSE